MVAGSELPSYPATFGIYHFIGPVLLLSGAAQAFEARCASPTQPVMLQGRSSRQAIRPKPNSSARALSPQAAYAQEHGSRLGTCTLRVGRAKLGGERGILITAIDQKQNKASLFCRGARATDCLVRTAKPREEPTNWGRGSIIKAPIARGQFAYRIERADAGALLVILFGPDITASLDPSPTLRSDLAH